MGLGGCRGWGWLVERWGVWVRWVVGCEEECGGVVRYVCEGWEGGRKGGRERGGGV